MTQALPDTLSLIGNTPLVRLRGPSEAAGAEIYGKCEFANPGASVKDRAALWIVRDAEQRGTLRPGGTIAQIGVLTHAAGAANEPFPLASILHKQERIQGLYVGSRADFLALNRAISLAQLRPVGENFHWSQARKALARMEEGTHFGKLVLSVN